jgi:N-methylhydantoinase A
VTGEITLSRLADARYAGQSHELRIVAEAGADLAQVLHRAHRQAYGYDIPDEPVRIVTLRVVAQGAPILSHPPGDWDQGEGAPERSREIGLAGQTVTARVVSRAGLAPGDEVRGPALIEQPDTTTLLASGELAVVDEAGNLVVHLPG